jgi:hypothetical protein
MVRRVSKFSTPMARSSTSCPVRVEASNLFATMIPDMGGTLTDAAVSHARVSARQVAWCSLAIVIALYVVGAVSIPPGSLRHEIQTLPLWFPVVLGFQGRAIAKWTALPLFVFWLAIMTFIWLFLLGWARIVTGHFFPSEIAMTLVVEAASIIGLAVSAKWRTPVPGLSASGLVVLFTVLQLLAFRVSLVPYIARR